MIAWILLFVLVGINIRPSHQQIHEHVTKSTYIISSSRLYGTMFHLKYQGVIYGITNEHVCTLHPYLLVSTDHARPSVSKVLHTDPTYDVCILTPITDDGLDYSISPDPYIDVYSTGAPIQPILITVKGTLLQQVEEYKDLLPEDQCMRAEMKGLQVDPHPSGKCLVVRPTLFVDTLIGRGASGGPVVDSWGHVIGVTAALLTDNYALAVPISSVLGVIDQYIAKEGAK